MGTLIPVAFWMFVGILFLVQRGLAHLRVFDA